MGLDANHAKPLKESGPVPGMVMIPENASVIARTAYVLGWPLGNMHGRRETFTI